jgi:hypothetical protein
MLLTNALKLAEWQIFGNDSNKSKLGDVRFSRWLVWRWQLSRDIAPCSLVEVDRRFRGVYCPDDGGNMHPWNVKLLKDYTMLCPKSLTSSIRTTFTKKLNSGMLNTSSSESYLSVLLSKNATLKYKNYWGKDRLRVWEQAAVVCVE